MKSKEVRILGPSFDQEAYVLAQPDIVGGHFIGYFAGIRDIGQIAVIRGIEIVAAEEIASGNQELFDTFHKMDLSAPGRINMLHGTRVSVINGMLANQSITDNALVEHAQYTGRYLDEFEPRIPDKYRVN